MKISLRRSPCPGRHIYPVDEGERLGAAFCQQLISAPSLPYFLFENGQLWQLMFQNVTLPTEHSEISGSIRYPYAIRFIIPRKVLD